MKKYDLTYKGKKYPAIDMVLFSGTCEEMYVTISTTELEDRLISDIEGEVYPEEATDLDENIFYYITPEEINLTYSEIVKIVEDNL